MRYLITGGAGFIGSHLADALVERGDQVLILDDLSTGRLANVAHLVDGPHGHAVEVRQGSVLDFPLVSELVAGVDVVAHLAASVGVQLIVREPLKTLLNNVRGTEIVLDAAAAVGAKVMVTSTSEIYGKNAAGPLHEEADRILGSPLKSRWAYSTSKAVDEIFAYEYWKERGLPTVIVRLFNCAGPRQTGAYGMVIPRFVRQALAGEEITVYGSGGQSRCFCHVHDTVEGLLRVLDAPEAIGQVFNVGALNETTIMGLAETVVRITGASSPIRRLSYEEAYEPGFEDMERRIPDISKMARVLGWHPRRSLDEIVADVVRYEQSQSVGAQA